jgi:hypothetical protein
MPRMNISVDACCNGSVARVKMKICENFDARRTVVREKLLGVCWMTIDNNPFVIVILLLGETLEGIWMSRNGPKSAKTMPRLTEVARSKPIQQQSPGGIESLC